MKSSRYKEFQKKYRNDRAGFVRDCVNWDAPILEGARSAPYQEEIWSELDDRERVSVRGPHGLGKTALAAVAILHFALVWDGEDWKVPTLASVWRQLSEYLWPEIHKWAGVLRWDVIGREPFIRGIELMVRRLRLSTGAAFAIASKDAALIERAQASHLLYVFDESKSIKDKIWDSAEGAFAGGDVKWLAISTPGETSGRFYQIQSRQKGYHDWWVRHVTLEEAIAAGRMRPEWVEKRKEQWGEGSPIYQNRVLGEFADSPSDAIIPLSWVEAANERWQEWDKEGALTAVGVDVGGGLATGNQSVIAKAYDRFKIAELVKIPMASDPGVATMELTGRIAAMLRGKDATAIVDSIGIGAGVVHRLRELEYEAIDFVAGRKTSLMDKVDSYGFRNWRSAAWWITRELLEHGSGYDVCLPPDDELTGDLTTPKWKPVSAGLILVEPKEKVKERLPEGRSTDCGDAVVQVLVGKTLENARLLEEVRKKKPEVKSVWAPGYRIGKGLTRGRG